MTDLEPWVKAAILEHDARAARAKAEGRTALHRPYCRCASTWAGADYRDPGCEYFDV
ncbi:hypothetical protein SEA_MOOSEHEAD_60 [Gordonia phage Moosehead]|nr:hypothetical protein SEA_MOOSEHEAD_60 [Gordonia phage Moosehead]